MKVRHGLFGLTAMVAATVSLAAQVPVLTGLAAPYQNLQNSQPIHLAGNSYGAGQVAYGSVGTPLELSGTGLGGGGSVLFVPYKNGSIDPNASPVSAATTSWSPTFIKFFVPANASSGLVEVVTSGGTSNGLPFLAMGGTYSRWCPATPGGSPVQVDTTALDDGVVNKSYSMHLRASGGSGSYSWSLTSGTLPAGLSLSSSGIISGTPTTTSSPVNITVQAADTSIPQQHASASLSIQIEQQDGTISTVGLYSFQIQTPGGGSGYDSVGDVTNYSDSANGTWALYYDSLNRLATASESGTSSPYPNYCWQYDNFGNRLWQTSSATPYTSSNGGPNSCPVSAGPSVGGSYNANNQISDGLHQYDAAGNITVDSTTGNSYLYDGEGRICAMQLNVAGTNVMTQYIYDADGNRIAKGTISSWSCDTTSNGFTATAMYVLGPNGEQMTEMTNNSGTWQWRHTNVYAAGQQIATYDLDLSGTTPGPVYFHLSDWLGTRRQQTDYAGNPVLNFTGLPYGDGLATNPVSNGSVADATEHHFTGKERDSESGNDYFGARYYASSMGRFLSPDWAAVIEPVPYAKLGDPQTLNLYAYVGNNPLNRTDPTGHMSCGGEQHGFWWCVGHALGLKETQNEYNERISTERQWLVDNVANSAGQKNAFADASGKSIDGIYQKWNAAIAKAQCDIWMGCADGSPAPHPANDFARDATGALVLFRGGGYNVRFGVDVKVGEDGLLKPDGLGRPRGISVNEDPAKVSGFGDVTEVPQLPPELQFTQIGKPGHYEITPRGPMTPDRYVELIEELGGKAAEAPEP